MAATGPARAGPRDASRMAARQQRSAWRHAFGAAHCCGLIHCRRAVDRPADQPGSGCRMPADVATDGTGVAGAGANAVLFAGNSAVT
jgi:hypothetical protein